MAFSRLKRLSSLFHLGFQPLNAARFSGVFQNNVLQPVRYSSSHIVQMRGLDYDTTEQVVIDFFKPLGITPKKVHLKCDGGGRTASVSEVEFNSHAEAVVAMRKRNAFIGNRFIRLTLKSEAADPVRKQDPSVESRKVGLNIKSHEKMTESPGGHFLRMKNAPWRITDQAIYDFFWHVGAYVTSVKPLYDESDLRTGEFDVQFLSHEDVRRAMSKNNSYLGSKFVELSLKRS